MDLFSNEVISQLTKELKEALNGVDKLKRKLQAKEQECERLKEENYKKVWCDMLLNKIEEIAKEKYPNTEYWIDTGSRLNCALEMLDTFKRSLKTKTNPYEYIKGLMPYMGINNVKKEKDLHKQLDQLKAENETYKKMLEDEEVIFALNEVRTGERHLWYNKAQKLEKALTEIKEIAEQMNNECFYDDFDCKDCDMKKGCTHFNKKQILQTISEVEDEHNG